MEIIITERQKDFLFTLAYEIVHKFNRLNKKGDKTAQKLFDNAASPAGCSLADGSIAAIKYVTGIEYERETVEPFAEAIQMHVFGDFPSKHFISAAEKKFLLKKYGLVCPDCGTIMTKATVDHIIPYCVVLDTLGKKNIRFTCPHCNLDKSSRIRDKDMFIIPDVGEMQSLRA